MLVYQRLVMVCASFVHALLNSFVHALFSLVLAHKGSLVFDHTLSFLSILRHPSLMHFSILVLSIVIVIYVSLPNSSPIHGECVLLLCAWKYERYWYPAPPQPHPRPGQVWVTLSVQMSKKWNEKWVRGWVNFECADEFLTDMGTGQSPALKVVFLLCFVLFCFVETTSLGNIVARPT